MKHSLIKIITPAMLISFLFSCQKEASIPDTSSAGTGTGSVAGVITDLSDNPVVNATVTGGTATTSTNANGQFTLTNVQFTADTVLLKVSKDGFFEGGENFVTTTNAVTNARIKLIPKPTPATVAASSGGNVVISGGGSVSFSPGFINASNGSAYAGNVAVSAVYLNPTDQKFSASTPGDIQVVSNTNKPGVLQSFGVVAIEMTDGSGNKLQLANGKTATITVPIPPAWQNNAPASMPLWYFDTTKGAWKQEGKATKQGSNYVGTVKHFSFWSPGDISGAVKFNVTFVDSATTVPIVNKLVTITRTDSSTTSGRTDNTGTVSGLVPVNEVLTLRVVDTCGAIAYSQNIGPFSADTILGQIKINDNNCYVAVDTAQFVNLTLKGIKYSWFANEITEWKIDSGTYYAIAFVAGDPGNTADSSTYFQGSIWNFSSSIGAGNYPFSIYTIVSFNNSYNTPGALNYGPVSTVTQFDPVGGYIAGTSSGFLHNLQNYGDSTAFSCTYRIKRIE